MCIYGDPAYPLQVHLQAPFRITVPNQDMEDFNKSMSAVRISVEWLFGDIASTYKFIDYKKNLKVALSSVGKMYIVAAILRNALTVFLTFALQVFRSSFLRNSIQYNMVKRALSFVLNRHWINEALLKRDIYTIKTAIYQAFDSICILSCTSQNQHSIKIRNTMIKGI